MQVLFLINYLQYYYLNENNNCITNKSIKYKAINYGKRKTYFCKRRCRRPQTLA